MGGSQQQQQPNSLCPGSEALDRSHPISASSKSILWKKYCESTSPGSQLEAAN